MKTKTSIFTPIPEQWGLRGDPDLWGELEQVMEEMDLDLGKDVFGAFLDKHFQDIIDSEGTLVGDHMVRFEHFPQTGMSGGVVDLNWWREIGLPLLKRRFEAL